MNNFKRMNLVLIMGVIASSLCVFAGGMKSINTDNSNDNIVIKKDEIKSVDDMINGEDDKNKDKKLDGNTANNIKLLSTLKITPEQVKDLKADDIKVAKVKTIKVGPKTRAKLGLDKKDDAEPVQHTTNISRGSDGGRYIPTTFSITFYTDTHGENGGYGGMVANNKRIQPGMVAGVSREQFGQHIVIPSFGKNIPGLEGRNTFVIEDLMAEDEATKGPNRIDVYVPRLPSEKYDDDAYTRRVNSYGRYQVKGYIVKK